MANPDVTPLPGKVSLRNLDPSDLRLFFEQQLNADANYMAAFTPKDPTDWDAFSAHWTKLLANPEIRIKTILFDGAVAGHIASFPRLGKTEVTYWIDKKYWGKGIATGALSEFLTLAGRPISARVAKDNSGSVRVLEKCGFVICGADKGFSNARGQEVEEFILELPVPSLVKEGPAPRPGSLIR